LHFALRTKDMDKVRVILGSRKQSQVADLEREYNAHLPKHDLKKDLLGSEGMQEAIELIGGAEAKEGLAEKRALLQGGVFESTTKDETARLAEEGTWQFNRIAALERRV